MGALVGFMKVLAIPLALLNILGGIVSGIWLAVLGEWGAIGWGILALAVSGIALSLVLMPSALLAVPAAHFGEKGNLFAMYILAFLSNLYVIAVVTVWCVAVLYFFAKRADANSIIPMLIWSYGVATGPWAWMAQKEQQGGGGFASVVYAFFSQVGYMVMVLAVLLARVTLIDVIVLFSVVMFIGLVIQFKALLELQREMRNAGS